MAEREARSLRARLRGSQEREAALTDAISKAIDAIDDMSRSAFERESRAAAILEEAIGRSPRTKE